MDAVQDAWSVSLQCPHCKRTGTPTIHDGPRFRVEVLTAGFRVIERPNSPDIRCATCKQFRTSKPTGVRTERVPRCRHKLARRYDDIGAGGGGGRWFLAFGWRRCWRVRSRGWGRVAAASAWAGCGEGGVLRREHQGRVDSQSFSFVARRLCTPRGTDGAAGHLSLRTPIIAAARRLTISRTPASASSRIRSAMSVFSDRACCSGVSESQASSSAALNAETVSGSYALGKSVPPSAMPRAR
jgi:hypothetical protein